MEGGRRLADVFVGIADPASEEGTARSGRSLGGGGQWRAGGADTFVETEERAKAGLGWLRQYLKLEHGIPSHDTSGRLFGRIDPSEFEPAFRRWASRVLPAPGPDAVVAFDGKTSRRSGKVGAAPLHLVGAFAAGASPVFGQTATAAKSDEKTAIPVLLQQPALQGCIATVNAMGTQANIARAIHGKKKAGYALAVEDNQPTLTDSIRDFCARFKSVPPAKTPHDFFESIEKDHGRIEYRRCYVFHQLDCLHKPERWADLKSFVVAESERAVRGKTIVEQRFYISSLPPEAKRISLAIRRHRAVGSRLHWCMDAVFGDGQMRARSGYAALKHPTPTSSALTTFPVKAVSRSDASSHSSDWHDSCRCPDSRPKAFTDDPVIR